MAARAFLDALQTLGVSGPSLEPDKEAIVAIADYVQKVAAGTESSSDESRNPGCGRVIRVTGSGSVIPTRNSEAQVEVTYILHRLVNHLGSSIPGAREKSAVALGCLVNAWLQSGLIVDVSSLHPLLECFTNLMSVLECSADEARCQRIGFLWGIRILMELGYFAVPSTLEDALDLYPRLFSLSQAPGFALFGGELAGDIAYRLTRILVDNGNKRVVEADQRVVAFFNGFHKDTANLLATATPIGKSNADGRLSTLVARCIYILRLLSLQNATTNGSKRPVVLDLETKLVSVAANHPEKFIRSIIRLMFAFSSKISFAALPSLLLLAVIEWEIAQPDRWKGLTPTAMLANAINDLCFKDESNGESKSSVQHLKFLGLRMMFNVLMWSKVVSTLQSYAAFNVQRLFTHILMGPSTKQFRHHWLGTAASKHRTAASVPFSLEYLGYALQGNAPPLHVLWQSAMQMAAGDRLEVKAGEPSRLEKNPIGFLSVCDHLQPYEWVHCPETIYEHSFQKPLVLSETEKQALYESLSGEIQTLGTIRHPLMAIIDGALGASQINGASIKRHFEVGSTLHPVESARSLTNRIVKVNQKDLEPPLCGLVILAASFVPDLADVDVPSSILQWIGQPRLPTYGKITLITDVQRSVLLNVVNYLGLNLRLALIRRFSKIRDVDEVPQQDIKLLHDVVEYLLRSPTLRQADIPISVLGDISESWLILFSLPLTILRLAKATCTSPNATDDTHAYSAFESQLAVASRLAFTTPAIDVNTPEGAEVIIGQLSSFNLEVPTLSQVALATLPETGKELISLLKRLAAPVTLAQFAVSFGVNLCTLAPESAFDPLWNLILGSGDRPTARDQDEKNDDESAVMSDGDDGPTTDGEEHALEEASGSNIVTAAEDKDSGEQTDTSEDEDDEDGDAILNALSKLSFGKDDMEDDTVLRVESAGDLISFLTDADADIDSEKQQAFLLARKAAADARRGPSMIELSNAHGKRIRALKMFQSRIKSMSANYVTAITSEGYDDLDNPLEFLHMSLSRTCQIWSQYAVVGRKTLYESKTVLGRHRQCLKEAWVKRLSEFLIETTSDLRKLGQTLNQKPKWVTDARQIHAENVVSLYALSVDAISHFLDSSRKGWFAATPALWKTAAGFVDAIGLACDKVMISGTSLTKASIAAILDVERKEAGSNIWSIEFREKMCMHPYGIRCKRSSGRPVSKGIAAGCWKVSFSEALLAALADNEFRDEGGKKTQLNNLLRAVKDLTPHRLSPILYECTVPRFQRVPLIREAIGIFQQSSHSR